MPAKPKKNYSATSQPTKDLCQTPPYAVDLLVPHLPANAFVWEPFAGELLIYRRLRERGFTVIPSDLLTGFDFFTFPLAAHLYDLIVSNPPFSKKYAILKALCEQEKPFAMLMPSDTLFAGTAQVLIERHRIEILLPRRRINFKMPEAAWRGTAQMSTAWFTRGLNIGRLVTFVDLKPWKPADVEAWEHAS